MKYQNETAFRHDAPEATGVLLVNLGTPDAPDVPAVRRSDHIGGDLTPVPVAPQRHQPVQGVVPAGYVGEGERRVVLRFSCFAYSTHFNMPCTT